MRLRGKGRKSQAENDKTDLGFAGTTNQVRRHVHLE